MGFSRQEYWSGLPFPSQIFSTQGLNPGLPHCRQTLYLLSHRGFPLKVYWDLLSVEHRLGFWQIGIQESLHSIHSSDNWGSERERDFAQGSWWSPVSLFYSWRPFPSMCWLSKTTRLLLDLGTRNPYPRLQAWEGPSWEAKSLGNWIVLLPRDALLPPCPPFILGYTLDA